MRTTPDPVADVLAYFATLRRAISPEIPRKDSPHRFAALPLFPDQWAYVLDYRQNMILHAEGFDKVLGYPNGSIDLRFIFEYVHPDDRLAVSRIVERAVRCMYSTRPVMRPFAQVMSIDCRVRMANGTYIKMLRQTSVFEVDADSDSVISTISICKAITDIKPSDQVGWQYVTEGPEQLDMRDILQDNGNLVYRPTPREMDIIRKLAEGKNSKIIGLELHISEHTVNNHRRNLLQRTGFRNTAELVSRMMESGLL